MCKGTNKQLLKVKVSLFFARYLPRDRTHTQRTNRRQNKSTYLFWEQTIRNTKGQQEGLVVFGRCQMT